jgi:hypothetical protein
MLFSVILLAGFAQAIQIPFQAPAIPALKTINYTGNGLPIAANALAGHYDQLQGLFTPFESLSKLSLDSFTSLSHPLFPNYNVRIKKSDFCDGTVK